MPATQLLAYVPSYGPVSAPNEGYGFLDTGSKFNIIGSGASGVLRHTASNAAAPWNTEQLVRKGSAEACVNQQIEARFIYNDASNSNLWAYLRYTASTETSPSGIVVGMATGQVGTVVNGTLASPSANKFSPAAAVGGLYDCRITITQTDANTTTIVGTQWNATAGNAFASGTQTATFTTTTTVAALQNVSGGMGVFWFSSSTGTSPTRDIYLLNTYALDAVNAATAYEFIGPPGGVSGSASSPFLALANGSLASAVTITPSDGSNGGTFSPASATLAVGSFSKAIFTYTPASTGTKSLAATNSGSLTNPAAVSFAATAAPNILGVASNAFTFSPGNWKGDTGRGGSVYRQTWNNGAWALIQWNASASPTAVLMLNSASSGSNISYFLNGILTDAVAVSNGNVTISGINASALNTLFVVVRNSPQSARWNNAANTVQITGLQVDSGSSAPASARAARLWALFVGDSITEGIQTTSTGADTTLLDYSYLVGRTLDALGYDICVNACGSSGWIRPGDDTGDVPAYYAVSGGTYSDSTSRWNKIDQGVSVLDGNGQLSAYGATGTAPSIIYINYGTNESLQSSTASDVTASVTQCLTALRAAAPSALILIQIPFGLRATSKFANGLTYVNAITAGVTAYKNAKPADTKIQLLDFGANFAVTITTPTSYAGTNGVHPNSNGHALIAPMVMNAIAQSLATANGSYSYTYS